MPAYAPPPNITLFVVKAELEGPVIRTEKYNLFGRLTDVYAYFAVERRKVYLG